MNAKIILDEEHASFENLKKEWEDKAKSIKTTDELKEFVDDLLDKYQHDYGTIIHAMWAAMMASFNVLEKSNQGGITGFQAGFLGWKAINEFIHTTKPCGARILFWNNLLYPQYEYTFRSIPIEDWQKVQKEANRIISEENKDNYSKHVWDHIQEIANGNVPFGLIVN